jgi:hypothetical protein
MRFLASVAYTPAMALPIGLALFGLLLLVTHRAGVRPADATVGRIRRVRRWNRLAPLLVLGMALLADVPGGFLSRPPAVAWWLYAAPVLGAVVPIAALLIGVTGERVVVEKPVVPVLRRTISSYGSRALFWIAGTAALILTLTTIWAGAASVPNEQGWYVWLPIAGNTSPEYSTFYGWGYGALVLVALLLLVALTWLLLARNASQPFVRPETVQRENVARIATAASALTIAGAATMFTLGQVWNFVGQSGSARVGTGIPGYGNIWFAPGYATFAPALVWIGFILQITAVIWLLVAASGRQFGMVKFPAIARASSEDS